MFSAMFDKRKLSNSERKRLLRFLLFRLKKGNGNIVTSVRDYMFKNDAKASRPVALMLERMEAGEEFAKVACDAGLLDERGTVLMSFAVNQLDALQAASDLNTTSDKSPTKYCIEKIAFHWVVNFALACFFMFKPVTDPMLMMYKNYAIAATSSGGQSIPVPSYLTEPMTLVMYSLCFGVVVFGVIGWLVIANKERADQVYRYVPMRFYEEWRPLLDFYLALRRSGHADSKAANILASVFNTGFLNTLFVEVSEGLKTKGRGLYETFSNYPKVFPREIMSFILDGEKTSQRDMYLAQARDFCEEKNKEYLQSLRALPHILTAINVLIYGLIGVDLSIDMLKLMVSPITG